jgi:hypothetical protein
VAENLEKRGASPPAITWFPHWRQEPSATRLDEDNDGRGSSRENVDSITDVISSSSETNVVLELMGGLSHWGLSLLLMY